jgi:replication factor A1
VTTKSVIRHWSNLKGTGHLFNIDLLDNGGGEIRGTFFKEASDKFFPILEEGKVSFIFISLFYYLLVCLLICFFVC